MINVSDILHDPDFQTTFVVTRSAGVFALGGWQSTAHVITMTGVANTSSGNDLQQVDAGDRVTGTMTFYSTRPLYETRAGAPQGLSDTITWQGDVYRLAKVWDRSANGYWKAVGVRTSGE
jgi:hypothetical protein